MKFYIITFIFIMNYAMRAYANNDDAMQNFTALNHTMISQFQDTRNEYKPRFLAKHPVIVALFNSNGGQFILYRPGESALYAAPLPQAMNYRLAGIIEHTTMQVYEITYHHIINHSPQTKQSWQGTMQTYQSNIAKALGDVDNLAITTREKILYKKLLSTANAFAIQCIKNGDTVSEVELNQYVKSIKPSLFELTDIVTAYQIKYWASVVQNWKANLGDKWQDTYGVVGYIYVSPEHNIFLQILARFMGPNVVNKRLFYFNTTSYTPNTDAALDLIANLQPDNELANEMFGKYYQQYSGILPRSALNALDNEFKSNSLFK